MHAGVGPWPHIYIYIYIYMGLHMSVLRQHQHIYNQWNNQQDEAWPGCRAAGRVGPGSSLGQVGHHEGDFGVHRGGSQVLAPILQNRSGCQPTRD